MLIQISIFLLVAHFLLPLYFIYALWRGRDDDRLDWLLKVLYSTVYLALILVIGRWDWLSHYLRFALVALFAGALVASFRRSRSLTALDRGKRWKWLNVGGTVLTLLLFLAALSFAIKGFFYPGEAVRLAFPLRDGSYYVGQGGDSPLINGHNSNHAQRFALDIVALNSAGARAQGLYPTALERYAIFGAAVHSPCDGTIATTVDGRPDLTPPEADRKQLVGNHVVITCQEVSVLLAHLQNGSVAVTPGQQVTTGQPLGRVGNSGNTTEPHLHIHAVRGTDGDILRGDPVPILFDGRFRTRNSILSR